MVHSLLPQDVLLLTKLVSYGRQRPSIAEMASGVGLSPSQVHASIKRLERSRLIAPSSHEPRLRAVEEFLVHCVKYVFPALRGEAARGMPTAYAAPPLKEAIAGEVRGLTLEPLHKAVPGAARRDRVLYELLALVDALRDGRTRERQLAERELMARLRSQLRG
jgi:hypothetical protein